MVADACEDFGLTLTRMPDGLDETFQKGIPDWIHIGNPFDIWLVEMIDGNYPEVFGISLEALLRSSEANGVAVILPLINLSFRSIRRRPSYATFLKTFPLLKGLRDDASADLTSPADCLERPVVSCAGNTGHCGAGSESGHGHDGGMLCRG